MPALLGVVERLERLGDVALFGPSALAELGVLVPFDHGVFNRIDPQARQVRFDVHPPDAPTPSWTFDTYDNYLPQNPIFQHVHGSGDGATRRLSDFLRRADLHALPLYTDVLGPLGIEYQVAFSIAYRRPLMLAFSLSRSHRDFTDDEIATLDLLRPHLSRTYRRLRRKATEGVPTLEQVFGLTHRETEILDKLVTGMTVLSIAEALKIAESTVRKHLEHTYRKLGVANRAAATAVAAQYVRDSS